MLPTVMEGTSQAGPGSKDAMKRASGTNSDHLVPHNLRRSKVHVDVQYPAGSEKPYLGAQVTPRGFMKWDAPLVLVMLS